MKLKQALVLIGLLLLIGWLSLRYSANQVEKVHEPTPKVDGNTSSLPGGSTTSASWIVALDFSEGGEFCIADQIEEEDK